MRLIILAFIISISLHLLFISTYKIHKDVSKTNTEKKSLKKSDITYVKIKKQEPKVVKKPEIKSVEKPKTVKKTEKKIVKKKVTKKLEKKKVSKPKKIQSTKKYTKPKKTKQVRKKPVKKVIKKSLQDKILKDQIVNKKTSIQQKTLEDFLSQKDPVNEKTLSAIERLYGREFQSFTKVQKAFIEKNLNQFQQITQRVLNRLGYPPLAAKRRIAGTNVVEFMFYPDGSIRNLKITSSSGYSVFDNYSLELIEIAYKDYPRPKTATKLKFYVNYRLY